ncbi:MAG: type III secretion system inner membrane ring subunit SctD [Simkaniaceae bacterium]|nr:type III secretion system inner membrane ring subunit SctD [Simkaniaceae bacterium]
MASYLISEDGPLTGLKITLDEGNEWVLGRDPDQSDHVLEDPMVSRLHVIVRREDDGVFLENLSSTNPASVNGETVTEPIQLHENDAVQIGGSTFRYTEKDPADVEDLIEDDQSTPSGPSDEELRAQIAALSLSGGIHSRWLLKVIAGPNTGAEFGVDEGQTYVIGKDANSCDIFFQDLSVSRQHAKLSVKNGQVIIEDLGSRNGVLVNGSHIEKQQTLGSQDLIALGTTAFLMIDREESRETLYSAPSELHKEEEVQEEPVEVPKNWKDTIVPTRHLVIAGCLGFLVLLGLFGITTLFKSSKVTVATSDQSREISRALRKFKGVEFNYNGGSGKLFLMGHVLTDIDQQEMLYLLRSLTFVHQIDNNVIIDDSVAESMNALLFKNPQWRAVMITPIEPGRFVLKGYLSSMTELGLLTEYVNNNFPYLDKLENRVVVETNLETEIQGALIERGFSSVTFEFSNGELVLSGRVNSDEGSAFDDAMSALKKIAGIHVVKSIVTYTDAKSARIDLTNRFNVTGTSKVGNKNQFVLINGQILTKGDQLEGMTITDITSKEVLLERDGMKYKIDYNQR